MIQSRDQCTRFAARLAVIGGGLGIAAGLVQAIIGSRIPDWTGDKDSPLALGLLTIALGLSVVAAARTLRSTTTPRPETLTAVTLWLAAVAVVCSTTVGRLWIIPEALLLAAAGLTLVACGWHAFRTVITSHWLRGLLGLLGVFELLMAVSARPATTIAAGVVGGSALIAAAILSGPGRRTIVMLLVAMTLPLVALTWWTIATPLVSIVALAIGVATTGCVPSPVAADRGPQLAGRSSAVT